MLYIREMVEVNNNTHSEDEDKVVGSAGYSVIKLTKNTGGADATLRLSEGTTSYIVIVVELFCGADNKLLHLTCGKLNNKINPVGVVLQ